MELEREVSKMWNTKRRIGTRSTQEGIKALPDLSVSKTQKIPLMDIKHIICEVLQWTSVFITEEAH